MKNRDLEYVIRDDMPIGNFGDNLNLSSWQSSSKPLTYQEKKRILLGEWTSSSLKAGIFIFRFCDLVYYVGINFQRSRG